MQIIKKLLVNYKFTILAVILILVAILMPANDIPSVGVPGIDKVVHCGMFGFLTLCFYGEYFYKNKRNPKALCAIGAIAAYAAFTEFLQLFVEGRACDFIDWLADSLGIILAALVFYLFINWLNNKKANKITK